jgi:predicted esterase
LKIEGTENVPAILQLSRGDPPHPAVLLLHGFSSHKEQMAESIGRALRDRGIASLSFDLPLHGSRGRVLGTESLRNPLALIQSWRLAQREAHAAIRFLAKHPEIDRQRIGIAGYSLGAYLAVVVAASDRNVRVVALAAGGDLPAETPFVGLVRAVADPIRAVRALAGRPLFMINGTRDRTIRPAQARLLYAAAGDPKHLQWYDGGHWPPQPAIDAVAEWLARELRASHDGAAARPA